MKNYFEPLSDCIIKFENYDSFELVFAMLKVLIVGHAPLPNENTKHTYALGKRTWQFVKPLIDKGYEVCLIAFRLSTSQNDQATNNPKHTFTYYNLESNIMYDSEYLLSLIHSFEPDCCIGVTTLASSILARLDLKIPFWADLYGSIMAESQVKAATFNDDQDFYYFVNLEQSVLSLADKISTVSKAQRLSVIGELGLVGRLNSYTAGYEFVHTIPVGGDNETYVPTQNVIRNIITPDNAFVILYSGGYNTWLDIQTLFDGVEGAMRQDDEIHFVSTGGEIIGHDNQTYASFKTLISQSSYKDHFHLCGWVNSDSLHNYYLESNVGIIADKLCYEAELGSRTRIIDWLRAELPAVCNPISEITIEIEQSGIGFCFEIGNAQTLTSQLLMLKRNPQLIQNAKEKTRNIFKEIYSIEATMPPLINWLTQDVQYAPDYDKDFPRTTATAQSVLAEPYTQTWYTLLKLIWSKFIFELSSSRLRRLAPIFKTISKYIKRFRQKVSSYE